jgi:hypothetical protein
VIAFLSGMKMMRVEEPLTASGGELKLAALNSVSVLRKRGRTCNCCPEPNSANGVHVKSVPKEIMKKTTGIIAGLICGSALLTIVGCSTAEKKPQNQLIMTQLAASKPPQNNTAQTTGPSGNGGYIPGAGSTTCCGSYVGMTYITNSATGTFWFTPPTGTTNCVATDSSGLASPYESVVKVTRRRDNLSWCNTNNVSFPASSSEQYRFYIYIKNTPPPPSAGDTLTLDVQWNP